MSATLETRCALAFELPSLSDPTKLATLMIDLSLDSLVPGRQAPVPTAQLPAGLLGHLEVLAILGGTAVIVAGMERLEQAEAVHFQVPGLPVMLSELVHWLLVRHPDPIATATRLHEALLKGPQHGGDPHNQQAPYLVTGDVVTAGFLAHPHYGLVAHDEQRTQQLAAVVYGFLISPARGHLLSRVKGMGFMQEQVELKEEISHSAYLALLAIPAMVSEYHAWSGYSLDGDDNVQQWPVGEGILAALAQANYEQVPEADQNRFLGEFLDSFIFGLGGAEPVRPHYPAERQRIDLSPERLELLKNTLKQVNVTPRSTAANRTAFSDN